jgi:hypothetical protein
LISILTKEYFKMAAAEQSFDIPKECWAGVVKNEGPGRTVLRSIND